MLVGALFRISNFLTPHPPAGGGHLTTKRWSHGFKPCDHPFIIPEGGMAAPFLQTAGDMQHHFGLRHSRRLQSRPGRELQWKTMADRLCSKDQPTHLQHRERRARRDRQTDQPTHLQHRERARRERQTCAQTGTSSDVLETLDVGFHSINNGKAQVHHTEKNSSGAGGISHLVLNFSWHAHFVNKCNVDRYDHP